MQFCPFRVLLGGEDIGDDEVPEWGVLPCPTSLAHAIPRPHGVDCDRVANHAESQRGSKKKRLLLDGCSIVSITQTIRSVGRRPS